MTRPGSSSTSLCWMDTYVTLFLICDLWPSFLLTPLHGRPLTGHRMSSLMSCHRLVKNQEITPKKSNMKPTP